MTTPVSGSGTSEEVLPQPLAFFEHNGIPQALWIVTSCYFIYRLTFHLLLLLINQSLQKSVNIKSAKPTLPHRVVINLQ